MNYQELVRLEKASHSNCRVCVDCNGLACKGECPGVGGIGSGESFINNRKSFGKYALKFDVLSDVREVDTSTTLFGKKVSSPIMVAPVAGIRNNYGFDVDDLTHFTYLMEAGIHCNNFVFSGDGINVEKMFEEPLRVIDHYDGFGIVTMKPWVDKGLQLRYPLLKQYKHTALAMDVDSAGLPALANSDIPVECKNVEKLSEIIHESGCKYFIIKGIMNREAALKAVQAGAQGIVISNHGGRVCDGCAGTMDVIEEIVEAVKGKVTILIDGGFRSGVDVFKALALGVDGVLIGRPFTLACAVAQKDGAIALYQHYVQELAHTMKMCGYASIDQIDSRCIVKR